MVVKFKKSTRQKKIKHGSNKRKSNKRKSNKRNLIRNIIAGAFSPVSASRKIQSMVRGRSIRQSRKSDELKSLLSQGAVKYKNALEKLDFRGVNMKDQVLSRRVLNGAKFQKVDFTGSKLNGAKLTAVNADGAIFKNCEFKKAILIICEFKKCNFTNTNFEGLTANSCNFKLAKFSRELPLTRGIIPLFKNASFIDCDLRAALFFGVRLSLSLFKECNLEGAMFYNMDINPVGMQILNCDLDNVLFQDSSILLPYIQFNAQYRNGGLKTIKNMKIVNTKTRQTIHQAVEFKNVTFENLHIEKILFQSKTKFEDCNFTGLTLKAGRADPARNGEPEAISVQFYQAKFIRCMFNDCDFGEFLGHSSEYRECYFENCNLSKCDLRSSQFNGSNFVNCDLNGVKFIRCHLDNVAFRDGTVLSNIDFQECQGMAGMNFQGINLQGARMIGITDPGLNACNFRDANLRGVQFDFSQIHGSDFTGADLTGSNVRVAEGSEQTVGIPADQEEGRAVDTHKTFYNIRINMLVDFYQDKSEMTAPYTAASDELLRNMAVTLLKRMINALDATTEEKSALNTGLNSCFTDRLNTYNFGQQIAGTDPSVNFRTLIYCALKYLEEQPKEFRDIYVQSLVIDSTQAYGPGGMSCAAGIVERFITVMEQAAVVVKDTKPEKAEEYVELINILTNDPKSLIKNYQQEWFEIHREGGPDAFAESAALDTIMDNYKVFLEAQFDYANLRGANKEKIERVIMNDPNAGVNITRDYIENSILFFGGRVKHNRHLGYFKMLRDRFYIRDRYNRLHRHSIKRRRRKKKKSRTSKKGRKGRKQ